MGSLPRSIAYRNDDQVAIADSLHRLTDRAAFDGAYYVDSETGAVDSRAGTNDVIEDGQLRTVLDDQLSVAMADTSQVTFSEPFETADGQPVILAVSTVPGESNHVVVGLVDLESLSQYMIGTDGADEVIVVDQSGTIVLAENQSLLLQDDGLDAASMSDGVGTMSIAADEAGAADDTVVGYAALENQDWTLTTRVPSSEAYSLQSDISNLILAMLAVVFGSILVLGVTVGRNTGKSLRSLSNRAAAIEDGNLDEPVESSRHDELGDLHRSIDRMRQSLRERLEEAEAARADADRARSASEQFSRHLEGTADQYGETMRACSDGDLTQRLDPDAESEAMETIAMEFNAMMDDMEATVAATRAFADAVDATAESTADGIVEVRSASEQVTTSVQQIANGADRQRDQLVTISSEIDELSTTTEEIAATSSEVATLAERTAQASADARESAQRAIAGMNAIEDEASDAVAEVAQLEAEIDAIDDHLEFIGDLTRETNILALNASIEAARSTSGSNNAEFTEVAEQVKSLAEDTKEAAKKIETRLEQVRQQTDQVAAVVRETDQQIANHRSAVETSVTALDEISEFAATTNDGVQEISAASQQQAVATQEVVTMIDDVTAISEETSAETDTVAAAAEEQTSLLVEVSHTASSLSDRARDLSGSLSSFEVSVEPSAVDGTELAQPREGILVANSVDGDELIDPTADDGPDRPVSVPGDADGEIESATNGESATDSGFTWDDSA